jgi:hypothetical protein
MARERILKHMDFVESLTWDLSTCRWHRERSRRTRSIQHNQQKDAIGLLTIHRESLRFVLNTSGQDFSAHRAHPRNCIRDTLPSAIVPGRLRERRQVNRSA